MFKKKKGNFFVKYEKKYNKILENRRKKIKNCSGVFSKENNKEKDNKSKQNQMSKRKKRKCKSENFSIQSK